MIMVMAKAMSQLCLCRNCNDRLYMQVTGTDTIYYDFAKN